jgi:hypothetical protein
VIEKKEFGIGKNEDNNNHKYYFANARSAMNYYDNIKDLFFKSAQ